MGLAASRVDLSPLSCRKEPSSGGAKHCYSWHSPATRLDVAFARQGTGHQPPLGRVRRHEPLTQAGLACDPRCPGTTLKLTAGHVAEFAHTPTRSMCNADSPALTTMAAGSASTELTVHLITLGNSGVGKSSLLLQYEENRFSPSYITTIGIDVTSRTEDLKVDPAGEPVRTQVKCWDTAGQERFRSISKQYLRKCQGAMLVYDVTDASTFEAVGGWMETLGGSEGLRKGAPLVLVANKVDMVDKRVVSEEAGRSAAASIGSGVPYIEASAATGANVREAFILLATEAAKVRMGRAKPSAAPPTVKPKAGSSSSSGKGCF